MRPDGKGYRRIVSDEEARTGSNHVVIRYTIANKRVLINQCIRTGGVYHRSISPALQKRGKADYSNPRVWSLVHLLNMMGKWIEKSQCDGTSIVRDET